MSRLTTNLQDLTLSKGAVMDILGVFNNGPDVSAPEADTLRHYEHVADAARECVDNLAHFIEYGIRGDLLTSDELVEYRTRLVFELALLGSLMYMIDSPLTN